MVVQSDKRVAELKLMRRGGTVVEQFKPTSEDFGLTYAIIAWMTELINDAIYLYL